VTCLQIHLLRIRESRYDCGMGKRHRNQRQHDGPGTRARLEQLLAKGDTRAAVEAAKLLVREEPGTTSESLVVRAYAERIKALIAEGLGREAAALASIVRERFPAHLSSWTSLLDDARFAAGDFDWILTELRDASEERRAAVEERLLPWIADPVAIARSAALDPADPLAREARIVAELFETVTSRIASPEEMATLGDIRRRSPFAPWKLLVRAIDAFHRNDDDRVSANVAAIDPRSSAARAGAVLTELTGGRPKGQRSFAAERLIDRISGGRATIAAQIRSIETASNNDDRRRVREEMRSLARSFDTLSPYAREQLRLALLPIVGIHFGPEQLAGFLRIGEHDPAMQRYGATIIESSGMPFAAGMWVEYAAGLVEARELEPWQAAEIYLHALSVGGDDDDDPFVCMDPTHGHPVEEQPDTARIIEKIIAARPAPAVLDRLTPHLDRLDTKELRRVLTAWRKADPDAPEPLVRLLRIAEKERRYDEALPLIRQGDRMKTIDPEYARLRLRLSLRKAEQLLSAKKREAAAALLDELAVHPEDLGEDAAAYVLALQWAAAAPARAAELLVQLAQRGVLGEIVLAEVTGELGMQFALPASHPSAEEILEGVRRGIGALQSAGVMPRHSAWLIERTKSSLDRADERQLLAIGSAALVCRMNEVAWAATARGLELGGPMLHRMLLFRAEILIEIQTDRIRTLAAIKAAHALAQRAHDRDIVARATELEHRLVFFRGNERRLSQDEITAIVEHERTAAMPVRREPSRTKAARKSKSKPKKERGLFEP
jgi:hypothetical protein